MNKEETMKYICLVSQLPGFKYGLGPVEIRSSGGEKIYFAMSPAKKEDEVKRFTQTAALRLPEREWFRQTAACQQSN